jgi:hypothetical protein
MKSLLFLLYLAAVTIPSMSIEGAAQVSSESRVEQGKVALSQMSPPMFPPLARQARISGEVKIRLLIRRDGSVESATAVAGNPLLMPAALDSARHSLFACSTCSAPSSAYELVYRFQIVDDLDRCCCSTGARAIREPEVSRLDNYISIKASPVCICPDQCAFDTARSQLKRRSAKCLYLWKCGVSHVFVQ